MLGVYGQSIFVDPELKLVLVLTAAAKTAKVGKETSVASATRSGAASSRVSAAGSYFFLGASRGMHLRAGVTPVGVILAPETSLTSPAGHVPSSTSTR